MQLQCSVTRQQPARRCVASCSTALGASTSLRFRRGTDSDSQLIQRVLWSETMNPLSLQPSRFQIALDEQGKPLGFGQLEPKGDNLYELRSIVVIEKADRGKGIGQALVNKLLLGLGPQDEVWLTTPRSRMRFYERAGFLGQTVDFALLKQIPSWLRVEAVVGAVVAPLAAGEPLSVMRRGPQQGSRP